GVPNIALNGLVIQLAGFVQDVAAANPDSEITLTGYSLAGSLAQVVGAYAKVQTVTFNSPGALTMLPYFANSLGSLQSLIIPSPSPDVWEYRFIGAIYSSFGTRVGVRISGKNPLISDDLLASTLLFLHNILTLWGDYHKIGLLGSTLASQPTTPGDIGALEQVGAPDAFLLDSLLVAPVSVGVAVFAVPSFQQNVLKGFDPPPGYGYSFAAAPGSPLFASIDLPIDNEVFGWQLTYHSGPAAGTLFSSTGHFAFAPAVDRIDFYPVDSALRPMFYPDPFFLGLTVDRDGDFEARLTVQTTPLDTTPHVCPQGQGFW